MEIQAIWFIVLAFMLTGYAILDGFDLGVGALHFLVGRTMGERGTSVDAIGPVWNGNEVWLLGAGGAMVVAFPHLYASGFSGFYLALMLVLWLLILRGVGIEFRHQVDSPLWKEIWDVVFSVSSALLAVLFGVAVGNVLIGVPFSSAGEFVGSFSVMLNPFAILGGVLSLVILSMHGAAYLAMKTLGAVQERSQKLVRGLWFAVMALIAAVLAASAYVRPDFADNFKQNPVLMLIPAIGIAAAIALYMFAARKDDTKAFLSSSVLIAGILGSVAAGLFPNLLPARPGSSFEGLTIYNASSPARSQEIALGIYLFGLALVSIYLWHAYRTWSGKVTEEEGLYH